MVKIVGQDNNSSVVVDESKTLIDPIIVLRGKDGKDGLQGPEGLPGRDGVDGRDGKDGRDGVDGKDGKDGVSFWIEYDKKNDELVFKNDGGKKNPEPIKLSKLSKSWGFGVGKSGGGQVQADWNQTDKNNPTFIKNKPVIHNVEFRKVDVLPDVGETYVFYLVPVDDPEVSNIYDEYIWVLQPDETYGWEKIGTTEVDLSGYVPTSRKINNKALTEDITLTASDVGALPDNTFIPTDTSDLTNSAGYITGITSSDVTNALGYTPPTINSSNNYVPYRSSATAFSNSTLMYNSSAMAFTGKLHVGSTSPSTYSNFGRFTIYDNTPGKQVTSMALLNYGGGGGCGVAIDMYNTSANSGIPSGRFGLIDNGNYSGYLQLQVKKSGASNNPLLPAMNIVPVPATSSLTTCIAFGKDEFNNVLFDLHKPEEICSIADSDKRWSGSGTTYSQNGSNKFNSRLMVAVGDIVYFTAGTEATVISIVSNTSTHQITVDRTLGSINNQRLYVKKAYFKVTDENYNTKIIINPYAKMGLGTSAPAYDLDVNGTINANTDVKINGSSVALASSVPTDTSDLTNGAGYITSSALSGYQTTANLVTSVSSSSTDTQYPSAKLFYDTCGDIETLINAL